MREYNIDLKLTDDGIYEEDIDTIYYGIDPKKRLKKMSLNKFIKRLYDDHWIGTKIINDSACTSYVLVLKNYGVKLSISIPKDENYINNHSQFISGGIELLKQMCKDAEIVNNNVISFNNFSDMTNKSQREAKPDLKLIRGTKYNPSIKKVLKTSNGKIVLVTVMAGLIAIGVTSAIAIKNIKEARETMDDTKKYSYQSTPDSSNINPSDFYDAKKEGNVDYSLVSENDNVEAMKMDYNEQNYQIRR